MTDEDASIIHSLISECELKLKDIDSSLSILTKNKIDTTIYEKEISRIQRILYNTDKKITENRNNTSSIKNFVLERTVLEECSESILKLKNAIIEYENKITESKIHISPTGLDLEQVRVQGEALLRDISEMRLSENTKKHFLNEGEIENDLDIQTTRIDEDIESRNEKNTNLKSTYSKNKLGEAAHEYKNSIGFRVDIFPDLNTNILDLSFKNKLRIQDSIGKHIQYTPRMVWHNPRTDFPSIPLSKFSNPGFFDQLGLDTLLFIFYFQQGTFQQFLAIQELKRKKWRFHKKCFAWFYKRSDAKITTEDAEVADYIYFDFEKDWCQKIKNDFTFEFAYLDNTPIIVNKFNNESNICCNSDSNISNELINNSFAKDSK